jgi:hypothetical protein
MATGCYSSSVWSNQARAERFSVGRYSYHRWASVRSRWSKSVHVKS